MRAFLHCLLLFLSVNLLSEETELQKIDGIIKKLSNDQYTIRSKAKEDLIPFAATYKEYLVKKAHNTQDLETQESLIYIINHSANKAKELYEAQMVLAKKYFVDKNYKQALSEVTKASNIQEIALHDIPLLIEIYQHANNDEVLIAILEKYLDINQKEASKLNIFPKDKANLYTDLIYAYMYTKKFDQATKLLDKIEKDGLSNSRTLRAHAVALNLSGKPDEAEKFYLELLKKSPNSHEMHHYLLWLYISRNDKEKYNKQFALFQKNYAELNLTLNSYILDYWFANKEEEACNKLSISLKNIIKIFSESNSISRVPNNIYFLFIHIYLCKKNKIESNYDFSQWYKKITTDMQNQWPSQILGLYSKDLTIEDVIKAMASPSNKITKERESEGYFYIALYQLMNDQKNEAKINLQKSINAGIFDFIETTAAQHLLNQLSDSN